MSDTTITPEERARLRAIAAKPNHLSHRDGIHAALNNLLDALEQAEARAEKAEAEHTRLTKIVDFMAQQMADVYSTDEDGRYTNRIRLTKRLCVKAEVGHFCLHAIRHLTATLLAKEGVPMKDIQAILRHKRLATTENYIARMMPRENVLEGVLVKRERPETLQRFEPEKSEVPHGGPQFETPSVKLQ